MLLGLIPGRLRLCPRSKTCSNTHKSGCEQRGSRKKRRCSSECGKNGARNDGTGCASCCGAYPVVVK
jgi:hypothetical protein